jgi:hypothetical protein
MCEKCRAARERNTAIKRALADVLYRPPAPDDPAHQVPGLVPFLAFARQLEAITRAPREAAEYEVDRALMATAILALSAEERTDLLRIAAYMIELARALHESVATAKLRQHDTDVSGIAVTIEGREVVIYVNGTPVQRIALDENADEVAVLDAAERAMQAHREMHDPSAG